MNTTDYRRTDVAWPNSQGISRWDDRWLHSDVQYLANFYTHRLFKKLVEVGELK